MLNQPIYFNGTSFYDPNRNKLKNYTWLIGTGDNAIKKYGKITNEELGPRGGFRSVTFGDKKFISRKVAP